MEAKTEGINFLDEISRLPGGESIRLCIQCGTCTASCPNADRMRHSPSELIAMARAGMRREVLSSDAMWYCLSCYSCTARCPRGIKMTDFMHLLSYLSLSEHRVHHKTPTPTMYRLFNHYCSMGTLPEIWFMTRFYLQTNPFRAWHMLPVAFNLFKHHRLSIKSRKLSLAARDQVQAILAKAESMGGAA